LTPQKVRKKRKKREKVMALPGFMARIGRFWWGLGELSLLFHQDDQIFIISRPSRPATRLMVIHDVGAI
jgi:hypothetical protein